tara:strand:- start:936 stop:1358 length:423 start_codon:yes stop_codon:yes gene_type:complete
MAEEPIANGIKDLLATHVASSGWALHVGELPQTPDKVIMIADTGGPPPNPKWLIDFPTVQITIRGAPSAYLLTWAEGKAVKDLLLGIASQTVNDDVWASITLGSDLAYIGRDEEFRHMFSLNLALIVHPQTNSNTNRLAL